MQLTFQPQSAGATLCELNDKYKKVNLYKTFLFFISLISKKYAIRTTGTQLIDPKLPYSDVDIVCSQILTTLSKPFASKFLFK